MPPFPEGYRIVQTIARRVLNQLGATLTPHDSERTIAARAQFFLAEAGVTETWYHACPALVLAGARTCLSQSGKDYRPAETPLGETTLVTVDLSPLREGCWGDCARSYCLEAGRVVGTPQDEEWRQGLSLLSELHRRFVEAACPELTLGDLCELANSWIEEAGFVNLDFMGNVGHTIEQRLADRRYLEPGNSLPSGAVKLFTFEPHVGLPGGRWGYKHEEIYCWEQGRLRSL